MSGEADVRTVIVPTGLGDVEIGVIEGNMAPVLFFPGGHCSAVSDCGWDLYAQLGHTVISFSRPGYGRTSVGDMDADGFVPAVQQVCWALGLDDLAAVVGVSFGGLQAVHTVASGRLGTPKLVLHSAAPSGLPDPDTVAERLAGPIIFGRHMQHLTWAAIRRTVATDRGLRMMWGALSTKPIDSWWPHLTAQERHQGREFFVGMRSDRGFSNDLRQARPEGQKYRDQIHRKITSPTLITASRLDGSVAFAHAQNFATTITGAQLIELDAPNHLFWIGPWAEPAYQAVADFLTA